MASIGTPNTKINSFNSAFNLLGAATTKLVPNTNTGSFKALALPSTGVSFGLGDSTQFTSGAADLASGAVYSALDLYSVVANADTFLGTFALYTGADGNGHNAGDLTFTAFAAIPEPSVYAAVLGVATLGFVAIRRRKQTLIA